MNDVIQHTPDTKQLLSPFKLGPYTLLNRMVMAPMTRNRASEDGVPVAANVLYYTQRVSAGLIITEGSQISPQGVGYPGTPGIHSDAQVVGWKNVTRAVHDRGGHIFLQLWHVGRISHPSLQPDNALPVAPSAVRPRGEAFTRQGLQPFVTPRALEMQEIADIVDDFGSAAKNAMEAGFDGVEIHAANGYLIDQFLRDGSNRREDRYGGPIENRARLLLEITECVCDVWGGERVGVRLSPMNPFNDMYDADPESLFSHVVDKLNPFDLAYLHIVEGAIHAPEISRPAFDIDILRQRYQGTYMANGGYNKRRAVQAICDGYADLVSFGEYFIANPDLPLRFAAGAPLNIPDPATYYGGDEAGYTDYPMMGKLEDDCIVRNSHMNQI